MAGLPCTKLDSSLFSEQCMPHACMHRLDAWFIGVCDSSCG